jgi:hypothetical protein
MKFENEFPSLRGKWDKTNGSHDFFFIKETVKEYCLDKQRVKEIIEKNSSFELAGKKYISYTHLMKELGMENIKFETKLEACPKLKKYFEEAYISKQKVQDEILKLIKLGNKNNQKREYFIPLEVLLIELGGV